MWGLRDEDGLRVGTTLVENVWLLSLRNDVENEQDSRCRLVSFWNCNRYMEIGGTTSTPHAWTGLVRVVGQRP